MGKDIKDISLFRAKKRELHYAKDVEKSTI